MAKKETAKKQGALSLEDQIKVLREKLSKKDQDTAQSLADSSPDVVRLAFKLLPKQGSNTGLSKKENAFYQEMLKVNAKAADEWKEQKIQSKSK